MSQVPGPRLAHGSQSRQGLLPDRGWHPAMVPCFGSAQCQYHVQMSARVHHSTSSRARIARVY